MADARRQRRFRIRVFHPRGQYVRAVIALPEALYWADDEIVFCVTLTKRWGPIDEEAPYTEMDWLSPDELRFVGSILLCELCEHGRLRFYPIPNYSPVLNRMNIDLTKRSTAEAIRNVVILGLDRHGYGVQSYLQDCLRLRYWLMTDDQVDLCRQTQFWNCVNTEDKILLRGLGALMKADMLSCYHEFTEEAIISCFIALEASFQMILKRLKAEGVKNPNAKDAATWLYKHFDSHLGFQQPLDRYFSEFYDQRVMTFHPLSRFGESLYAPLAQDDYIHLRESLSSIFAYLVSGEHDKEFLKTIERLKMERRLYP